MVVRSGYGIFYEAEGTDGRLNFNFIPFRVSETVTAAVNAVPNRTLADFWLGVPVGASVGSVTWVPLPLEARPGRDQRWNMGIQRQLFSHTALDVDYVGTTGDHQTAAENINLPPAGAGSVQARRPYPVRQPVGADAGAVERLPGAADQLQQRPCGALVSRLVYLLRVDPPGARTGDRRQLHLRTAPAVGHPAPVQRQLRLRAAVWQGTPVPVECRRCANAIVGGWQFQNIISYRSGLPYTPTVSRDVATPAWVDSGRTGSARASSRIRPSTCGSTRPRSSSPPRSPTETRDRASCARITSGTSTCRCSSDSRSAPARLSIQSRGVQRAQLDVLRCAEHQHRYGGGRKSDEHGEPGTDSVRFQAVF